jgi:hypothetical protein
VVGAYGDTPLLRFTIHCNYFLFIKESKLKLYDENLKPIKTLSLPHPLPLHYEVPLSVIARSNATKQSTSSGQAPQSQSSKIASASSGTPPRNDEGITLHYQLSVYDKEGREDRTGVGEIELQM